MISGGGGTAEVTEQFASAHATLRADPSIQFNLVPPPEPFKPPYWLEVLINWLGDALQSIGRFFYWIGSFFPDAAYARMFLWVMLAAAGAALLWAIYNRLRHGEWRLKLPRLASDTEIEIDEDWAPEETPVRSWLEEADALARQGRYGEAIHHLLFRSIEDIARRRPQVVRPALTTRELAGSPAIPERARELFTSIARLVERSLFGGRTVGEDDWLTARDAYSNFTLAGAWRR